MSQSVLDVLVILAAFGLFCGLSIVIDAVFGHKK